MTHPPAAATVRIWIDGIEEPAGAVSVLDQTFQRGDGCFEALRSYEGRLFDTGGHLDRLESSAAALDLPLPSRADLTAWLEKAAGEGDECVVRLVITRGVAGQKGHAVVTAEPVPARPSGYRLATVEAPWHPAGRSWELAGVKSVSYAPNMTATRVAQRASAHDALLVSDGTILEGPTFSAGWVVGGVVETPALDLGILASVTRRHVLELARASGIDVREGRWTIDRLRDAEEVMVWSTVKEVGSVVQVDELCYRPGPVTAELAGRFRELVSR